MDLRTGSTISLSLSDPRIGASSPMAVVAAHGTCHFSRACHPLSLPVTTARPSASSVSSPSAGPSLLLSSARFRAWLVYTPALRPSPHPTGKGGGRREERAGVVRVRAGRSDTEEAQGGAGAMPTQSVRDLQRPYQTSSPSERVNAFVRFLYGTATYAGLATAAVAGAQLAGLDWSGGFQLSLQGVLDGFAFSAPAIALVLALFQDRVAERWEVVRAVRDADDEETEEFFQGMAAWQYTVVAVSAALSEELFFRAALQAFLTRALLLSGAPSLDAPVVGMAALTGIWPYMAPCTQFCAATLTAALAGSLHYAMALPRDAVIVVTQSYSLGELRSAMRAWHERQEHQKIYPPMFASLLSLYYGIEWYMTGNLVSPMLTHALLNLTLLHMSLEVQ
ncbi:unnamed protein product [Closterium sp. Yama58-4]|nr:unnamed protein product [Closterium sp. Yama58-4]